MRKIYYISDGTGISAETLGKSLITQFSDINFTSKTLPFISTEQKALDVLNLINDSFNRDSLPPIVFSTIVNNKIREIILESKSLVIDFFHSHLGLIEKELGKEANNLVGLSHSLLDNNKYNVRIDAVNYTLEHDDGINVKGYKDADVILVGVSRSGKTPTCLYLALQFGIFAANYPLTEEDLEQNRFPSSLLPFKDKIIGLTISAERLHTIRERRKPNSNYSSISQCKKEVLQVDRMFREANIAFINSTHQSIEEISTQIISIADLKR